MNAALARVAGVTQTRAAGLVGKALDYYDLGKPRIMYLLLVTTVAAMIMAARGLPSAPVLLWTILGGALAAMSAGTLNCVYDADIDRLMKRTASRPIPSGRITIFAATTHACVMGVISFAIFYLRVNHLAAWLSLSGNVYYVALYTMLLKRRTPQNIVIGGAAGSIPPLVGWAAVTNHVGWPAVGLFAIIFLWTPPHFWSLALMTDTDYERAGVPMLPNVLGVRRTKIEILVYTLLLVAGSLVLWYPLHVMGALYAAAAAVLGLFFVRDVVRLLKTPDTRAGSERQAARSAFLYSLFYLAAICAFMVLDRFLL